MPTTSARRFTSSVMFQLIPKIALAPLFIVWLGVGSIIVLGEFAMQRWYGGEMPVGGVI
jgi:ABC-type nitrate/sulfonate/bicarbonate transport system permease component